MWPSAVMTITPEVAEKMMEANYERNRKIRTHAVTNYAAQMVNSEWKVTPEPIVVSVDGAIIDGQHRLSAIIASGTTQQMFVVQGVEHGVYDKLNRGLKRSIVDAFHVDKREAEVAKLFCSIFEEKSKITDDMVIAAINLISPVHRHLTGTKRKNNTAAPVRLAACIQAMITNSGYPIDCYDKFAIGEYYDLPPVFSILSRYLSDSPRLNGGKNAQQAKLIACIYAFDKSNANITRKTGFYKKTFSDLRSDFWHLWLETRQQTTD